ncbi:hypothetical protein [Cupriavidus necator]
MLDAANVLSAERGPANSVLGEPPSDNSAARERLVRARAQIDEIAARPPQEPQMDEIRRAIEKMFLPLLRAGGGNAAAVRCAG